jgi:hypothetical protein
MDKLTPLLESTRPSSPSSPRSNLPGATSKVFDNLITQSQQRLEAAQPQAPQSTMKQGSAEAKALQPILLGVLSEQSPTVSDLLLGHADLKADAWNIIYSEVNKDKAYTQIRSGSAVYYQPHSGELSWSSPGAATQLNPSAGLPGSPPVPAADKLVAPSETASHREFVGILSASQPTVSHLLHADPRYRGRIWSILEAEGNQDKPFTSIAEGTKIYIDTATDAISWQTGSAATTTSAPPQPPLYTKNSTPETTLPLDLSEAVQPYLGRPYREINCYGLLVRGLKNLGLDYAGKDGLRDRLTSLAREKGLPENAFFNGEGIVAAAGKKVLAQTYTKVSDWTNEAGSAFAEMKDVLQKGQILSFSTPTRGHTGIISRRDDQWTFINSGRMDNHVSEAGSSHEVGEENLMEEIRNWFETANKNREPLLVTLGQLETLAANAPFARSLADSTRL